MKKISVRQYNHMKKNMARNLNDLSLRKKLRYLYYFCILIPIILTDAVILFSLFHAEQAEQDREMAAAASAVQYSITSFVESSTVVARGIYLDSSIQEFLRTQFQGPEDYFAQYQAVMRSSVLHGISGIDNTVITIYADNEGIVNGGGFLRRSNVEGEEWFKRYVESSYDTQLEFYYAPNDTRTVILLRNLSGHAREKTACFLKIELDYSRLAQNISNMNYAFPVYICVDNEVIISNQESNNLREAFPVFTKSDSAALEQEAVKETMKEYPQYQVVIDTVHNSPNMGFGALYGSNIKIYVMRRTNSVIAALLENSVLLVLLLLFNILSPQLIMNLLEKSITSRIFQLGDVFNQVDSDELIMIPEEGGRDEIGVLMSNYNRMAKRMNDLIDQVYRNRLREQEMDIARQNAELLALYSQINPHFLFNALESIRMRSILKDEHETADMVEKLAIMERQNVDWSTDTNTVKRELEFVEAYLSLQKYRFGDRLSYRIEMQEECADIMIPKLTITTFVENACVHGIETKTRPGWVFARVYMEKDTLCVEVEDTGGGMEESEVEILGERMRGACIDMLKEKGRVGIVNACLRIRMMTDSTADFSVESEKGVGTVILIRIPLEKTERAVQTC